MTNTSDQRFKCACGATWTGIQMEHCKVCHQTFNNTRTGDKHRFVAMQYAIVDDPIDGISQVLHEDIPHARDRGGKVLSENNEIRQCYTPAQMLVMGMNQEKNGSWNMGGKAYIPKEK